MQDNRLNPPYPLHNLRPTSGYTMEKFIKKIFTRLFTIIYLMAAFLLVLIAILIIGWSIWEIFANFRLGEELIKNTLHSVGAIIIAVAIIDVAKYMFEEEIFRSKELRSPEEARKTLTKIFVIISIAVSLEGLVYIFKAGTEDISLLPYAASLIVTAILAMVGLGIYQKLSIRTEKEDKGKK
jgi:putative exporter of polyketide antibiotics